MPKLTVVQGDDWEGIYVDEKLVSEGRSHDTLQAIVIAIEHKATGAVKRFVDCAWLTDEGNLPDKLSEVKFSE